MVAAACFAALIVICGILLAHWCATTIPLVQLELLKGAMAFLSAALVGGAVAFLFKIFEKDRDLATKAREEKRIRRTRDLETLRAVALEVLDVYNTVKLSRRMLRFHAELERSGAQKPSHFRIPEGAYQDIFPKLQQAQLNLERLEKQIDLTPQIGKLGPASDLSKMLGQAESYVRRVLKEFETGAHARDAGARLVSVVAECVTAGFLASSEERKDLRLPETAKEEFFKPMGKLQKLAIRLLTGSTAEITD